MIRPLSLLTAFMISGTTMVGCGPGGTPPPQAGQGGDWLVERLEAEPPVLNPLLTTADAYTAHIADGHILQSLIERDRETTEFKPLLADSWEVSEDYLTYTFKLKEYVKFSDNTPMTSEDVRFTYDAVLNPANDTAISRSYFSYLESVETPDPYTVVIHCTEPYFKNLETFGTVPIIPKHIFGEGDFNRHPANRAAIVGTGPYKVESWSTSQQLVLARNENYWSPEAPAIGKLVFKFISDDLAAFQVLQQQQVDAMRVRSPEQWLGAASTPEFEAKFNKFELDSPVDGYLGTYAWIGWNNRRPMFQDKRVRQALTMLLDRQTMLETIFQGIGRVTSGHFFPKEPAYDQSIEPWPFDPARARQLLDEAGWVDSNNNGLRDKDGVEFRFTWNYGSGNAEYDRLATVYKEELAKAGIEVTLRPMEWAAFQVDVVNARNFDAIMMAWVLTADGDPYQIWHSSQAENGSNYVGFVNEEADRIIEAARVEFDNDKRDALYREFHAILHDEQPYTFLFNRVRMFAVDKRFQNVRPLALGFDVHEWTVPEGMERYR